MENLTTETHGEVPYSYVALGEHIVRAPGVCGGRPTFKYTRIEVAGVLERLASGENVESIVAGYEGRVSKEAIHEAMRIVMSGYLLTLPQLEAA